MLSTYSWAAYCKAVCKVYGRAVCVAPQKFRIIYGLFTVCIVCLCFLALIITGRNAITEWKAQVNSSWCLMEMLMGEAGFELTAFYGK